MILDNRKTIPTAELIPIRDMISDTIGMFFEERKFYFLEKRVAKRIAETNSKSARDYFRLLKHSGNTHELDELINLLTTNETYFYRNIPQLESFAEEALPLILAEKRKINNFKLKIWSAACSTGEEPYTMFILIKEKIPDISKWRIEIVATDIDTNVLMRAEKGNYDRRAVKDVPPNILRKYFIEKDGRYNIIPEAKKYIKFKRLNLSNRFEMRRMSEMDFVFCRNVLIYFSNDAKKEVVSRIYDSLNKGGFIFLGHSESVGKISAAYKLVKFKKSLSYRK